MLEIKNIKKSFGQTDVLHDISLSVNKGDVIAILGPSGSGKTTLAQAFQWVLYNERIRKDDTSSLPEFLREGRWRNYDI